MSEEDNHEILQRIGKLKLAHRDLDDAIVKMSDSAAVDEFQLRRMKVQKLSIKDSIGRLRSRLIPDLDA